MKIPRKDDLIRLQTIYKTDAKIAEALGGIPEYLIAYWRRKKNVPLLSEPKFTEQQIRELWERFGDDFRCGRELNLSKAAFYSWRRKYQILEKPAVLKLEQMELRLAGSDGVEATVMPSAKAAAPRTAAAKIVAHAREANSTHPYPFDWRIDPGQSSNDTVSVFPGIATSRGSLQSAQIPQADARISFTCSSQRGDLDWQLVEAHAVLPGQLIASPSPLLAGLGGLGCLVIGPRSLEAHGPVARIEVTRRLPNLVDVEDIALALLVHGASHILAGRVIEFDGGPIERLTVDRKVKLCSQAVAFGANAALCPFDDSIRRHFGRILYGRYPQTHPDRTAVYDEEHFLEARGIEPRVAAYNGLNWEVVPDSETGTGGVIVGPDAYPFEIELCAQALGGKSLKPGGPALLVCPATAQVYHLAFKRGWAQTILNAGGSIVDLTLSRRLGWDGLIRLASGNDTNKIVYATRLGSAALPVRIAGVQTALARSGLLADRI